MRMIDKVAREIANGTYDHPDTEPDQRRAYRQLAVDVLQAMIVPTDSMVSFGGRQQASDRGGPDSIWHVMIEAALLEKTNADD